MTVLVTGGVGMSRGRWLTDCWLSGCWLSGKGAGGEPQAGGGSDARIPDVGTGPGGQGFGVVA